MNAVSVRVDAASAATWSDAIQAATLFAIDPRGIGGVRLRAPAGALRDGWFASLREFLGAGTALHRVPCQIDDNRLLGGIDLAATLRSGRPRVERGLLAQSDRGVLVVQMAERLSQGTAARISAALDQDALQLERDGFSEAVPARVAVVACDEGIEAEELPPACLLDRLALWLDLNHLPWHVAAERAKLAPEQLQRARERYAAIEAGPDLFEALCGACAALGIDSLRVPLLALRVARAAAALDGDAAVGREHAALAARLVIAPRARALPPAPDAPEPPPSEAPEPPPADAAAPPDAKDESQRDDEQRDEQLGDPDLAEIVLEAVRAALPPELLAELSRGAARPVASKPVAGRTGVQARATHRGRPVGTRRGELRDGARLHVLETLRAAAPWQELRRRDRRAPPPEPGARRRIEVRREDFRIVRFNQRTQTTVIFAVDASGSAALHRLAEAKGAVELFLADCYVRRDQVALIAFRGREAQLLLPPTRSLARARRCLAGVPGGGGTPVAAGLRAAASVADAARRRGELPLVVMLTDGKANIALDGSGGRERAGSDALAMARLLRAAAVRSMLVDFSPRAQIEAQRLAQEMGARYLPLPRADATRVAEAVRTARLEAA